MKPIAPFPYYGGKSKMINWIDDHAPPATQLVDLFGGSGVVGLSMHNRYRKFVYNDLNERLWGFFNTLREQPEELIDAISKTPISRQEYGYCAEKSDDPIEDARRVFVRVNQSFGSLGLISKTANTWSTQAMPWDRMDKSIGNRIHTLPAISTILKNWHIENLDWAEVVKRYDHPDTFFFADPPYDLAVRSGGKGYVHEFENNIHVNLAKTLSECKGTAMVCGYHSDLYDELYKDWRLEEKEVTSSASAGAARVSKDVDAKRIECLWIKENIDANDLFHSMG